ncbi:hypothetical protein [Streptacidiphilus sp. PAMC 29251]
MVSPIAATAPTRTACRSTGEDQVQLRRTAWAAIGSISGTEGRGRWPTSSLSASRPVAAGASSESAVSASSPTSSSADCRAGPLSTGPAAGTASAR